jgi:predicted membrane protein
MNEDINKRLPAQVILGLVVIGMGLLFLLDNLDIFEISDVIRFWPMMFILVGALKLYDSHDAGGRVFGGVLVAIGVMLTLKHMGYIYFGWRTVWPVLIMLVGGAVVYNALRNRGEPFGVHIGYFQRNEKNAVDGDADSVIDLTAALGAIERRITSKDFRGGHVTTFMGGCELDLREASIVSEAEIRVFAVMGGISLRIPPDWTVVLRGTPIMAAFEEKTASPAAGAKRLIISGYAIMSGVEVRN